MYAAELAESNWLARCNSAAENMSSKETSRLFRSPTNPAQTTGGIKRQRVMHGFQGNSQQRADSLFDKYLCCIEDPVNQRYKYAGTRNETLDAPFELHHFEVALAKVERGTAPGRDHITVKV